MKTKEKGEKLDLDNISLKAAKTVIIMFPDL